MMTTPEPRNSCLTTWRPSHPRAKWLDDGRFWYRDIGADGADYVIVDPAKKTRTPAFDHVKLAVALQSNPRHLKISDFTYSEQGALLVTVHGAHEQLRCDLSGMRLLTPENADHAVKVSPNGSYFVDVYSTPTQPQTSIVRDNDGRLAMEIAKPDISKLAAAGWIPPVPFTVKARDGKTDLYGLLFKPTTFDQSKKYPIVNYVYPGPQTGSCASRRISAVRGDWQALAELGLWSFVSMAWGHLRGPRVFTKPITAIWKTTRFRTRLPA